MDPNFLYSHVQFMTTTGLTPSKIAVNDFFSNTEFKSKSLYMQYDHVNSNISDVNWWNIAANKSIRNSSSVESHFYVRQHNFVSLQPYRELIMLLGVIVVLYLFKCIK